jgi:hypothetical protein
MHYQKKLIIYRFKQLFHILDEIKYEFNYDIKDVENLDQNNFDYDLIINKNEIPNTLNQLTLKEFPIKITNLLEKINLEILKNNFQDKSEIKINRFRLDLNSRELFLSNQKLKLTEKETDMIIYLLNSKKSVSVNELQNEVWGYQADVETHTVETHIYRLKKKISEKFSYDDFIISDKNGYKIS